MDNTSKQAAEETEGLSHDGSAGAGGTNGEDAANSADGMEVYGPGEAVKVNQVGYLAKAAKLAIVEGEIPEATAFHVISLDTGDIAHSGTLSKAINDIASAETVSRADFSEFNIAGSYELAVDGIGRSYPFVIKEVMYEEQLATLLRSYTLQRSSVDIDDPVTGVKVPAGHLQDAEAIIYFDDGISRKGDIIDALGGWYDAGDFGKYISPAAVTVAQLLLAFELNPGAFYTGQMSFPQGLAPADGSELPDVLEEVRFELEWMLKMQRSDGAVYHKLSGASWPGFVMPHTDTQHRYVFGLSTFGTAQFAGAMAQAARVYKPFDEEFAARLLDAAEKAQSYLTANPAAGFRQDAGQDNGSGAYGKHSDAEERFWAAAELFRTTGGDQYKEAAEVYSGLMAKSAQPITWADAGLLGQWAYYNADGADETLKDNIASSLARSADETVKRVSGDGYLSALRLSDYHWASAKLAAAYGGLLLLADRMQPNEAYVAAALEQLHYVFGRTATGYSYATGIGEKYPQNPHHRTISASGVMFPGLVVGGPNRNGGDPDLDAVKDSLPPAKAYLDVLGSYSSNEYAIDYTAPVVMLAAYFAEYGLK